MNDELTTRILTKAEVDAILKALPAFLFRLWGNSVVTVLYGTRCNIHNDLQHVPMGVGISWLARFLSESERQDIFVPGASDLFIRDEQERVEILFCHEADIHISGSDKELVARVVGDDLFRGLMLASKDMP